MFFMKFVIIGAGAAGVAAAVKIKEIDRDARVIVLGEEIFFPYYRYQLTDFLCDSIERNKLIYTSPDFFKSKGISFRKGELVKSINSTQKHVKLLHNEIVSYDRLLIATGGAPILGPVLQPFAKHIQRYYSLQDIQVLKSKLSRIKSCLVYGDGLSCLDLIRGLTTLGKKITYIVKGEKAGWCLLNPDTLERIYDLLTEKGIEVITEDRVISIKRENQQYQVLTLKQRKLITDLVFAWDKYCPNLSCIKNLDIEKKIGIMVDEYLRTSVKDIYAAGDCVEIYHPGQKNYWINFGWKNAIEQGKIAGKNMAGKKDKYQIYEVLTFNLMGEPIEARCWE
jgi:NAD(P)H-nitrite reductase large subunit